MQFIMALLGRLDTDADVGLSQAVGDTYTSTLYRYHGFLVSSAFSVSQRASEPVSQRESGCSAERSRQAGRPVGRCNAGHSTRKAL